MATSAIYQHRQKIIRELIRKHGAQCAITGVKTGYLDTHEWLVKRSDLPIKKQQLKIFDKINMIIVSRAVHTSPDVDRLCYEWAVKEHGEDKIQAWLESLNLRTFGTLEQWKQRKKLTQKKPETNTTG